MRDLTPEKSAKAAEIAEFLCKFVIEKRNEEDKHNAKTYSNI